MAKPPRIVLLNGVVDNRDNMLDDSADQYSEDEANFPELLLNQVRTEGATQFILNLYLLSYFSTDGVLPLQSAIEETPNH